MMKSSRLAARKDPSIGVDTDAVLKVLEDPTTWRCVGCGPGENPGSLWLCLGNGVVGCEK